MLDPGLSNAVGPLRPGTQSYVTTCAQVAGKPMLHAARATAQRSLVVLDEVHHAGDGLSWGEAATFAFEPAARRLCLTGTPFRTRADERIPFVPYEPTADGLVSRADHTYGYGEALADGVIRPVVFTAYTGTARWRNSAGKVMAASLSDGGSRQTELAAWRPRWRLGPPRRRGHGRAITQLREHGMPDAAGLLLASDRDDARAYADVVTRVTGRRPVMILSDDPKASSRIERFAVSQDRIAVCVRMISEGVDIPRAAVLARMTSYRTPLFFAQAVGRVVRARGGHETATVFLPAVRPLLALAAALEVQRNHVLPSPAPAEEGGLDLPPREAPDGGATWEALEADARFAHVLAGGTAHVPRPSEGPVLDDAEAELIGLPGLLTPEQTALLLARRDDEHRRRAGRTRRAVGPPEDESVVSDLPDGAPLGPGGASWRDVVSLRREISRLVARVAARTSTPHAVVHTRLRVRVPGPRRRPRRSTCCGPAANSFWPCSDT